MTEIFPNFQVLSKNRWWTRAQIFLQSDADKWLIFADSTEDEGANPFSKSWVVGDNNREDTNSTILLIVTISDAYLLLSSRVIEKEKDFFPGWLASKICQEGWSHLPMKSCAGSPLSQKNRSINEFSELSSSSRRIQHLLLRKTSGPCISVGGDRLLHASLPNIEDAPKTDTELRLFSLVARQPRGGGKFHPYFLKEIEDVTMISFLARFGFSMLPLSMEYGVFAEHIWSVLCV